MTFIDTGIETSRIKRKERQTQVNANLCAQSNFIHGQHRTKKQKKKLRGKKNSVTFPAISGECNLLKGCLIFSEGFFRFFRLFF